MITESKKLEDLYERSQRIGGIIFDGMEGVFYPFPPGKVEYKHFEPRPGEVEVLGCLCALGEKPFPEHLVSVKFKACAEDTQYQLGECLEFHSLNHHEQDRALLSQDELKEHLEMELRLLEAGLTKGMDKNLGRKICGSGSSRSSV